MMLCFVFSALIVVLDQFFKRWIVRVIDIGEIGPEIIPGVLGLTHWENDGAMLNFLSGQQWLLAAIAFFAAVVLILILLRYNEGFWGTLGLAAVLGGTVGNLTDRVFNDGKVIDMFRTLFINFPIFNIADIFITLGFLTFLVHFIVLTFKAEPVADASGSGRSAGRDDYDGDFDETGADFDASEIDIGSIVEASPTEPSYAPTASTRAATAPQQQRTSSVAPGAHVTPLVTQQPQAQPLQTQQIQPQRVAAQPQPVQLQQTPVSEIDDISALLSDFDSTTDTTPDISEVDISYTMEALEAEFGSLDADYDVDELLREYGIDDN